MCMCECVWVCVCMCARVYMCVFVSVSTLVYLGVWVCARMFAGSTRTIYTCCTRTYVLRNFCQWYRMWFQPSLGLRHFCPFAPYLGIADAHNGNGVHLSEWQMWSREDACVHRRYGGCTTFAWKKRCKAEEVHGWVKGTVGTPLARKQM